MRIDFIKKRLQKICEDHTRSGGGSASVPLPVGLVNNSSPPTLEPLKKHATMVLNVQEAGETAHTTHQGMFEYGDPAGDDEI